MTIIRVFEHQRVLVRKDGGPDALTPWQAETLKKLLRGRPQTVVRWESDAVRFSQHCGVIGLGGDTIEILPKIYTQGDPGTHREVLLKMLYLAKRMKISPSGLAGINLQKNHLLDIFIHHFCDELFAQLHKGALLRYVHREENLSALRGRLLIDRQLKLNSHRPRLYCAFDELDEDNKYNQYIKCALKVAHRRAYSQQARRAAAELLHRFDRVRDYPPTKFHDWVPPEQRETKRFAGVFRQCGWFLRGLGQDVRAGEQESLSVLFNMNQLFEEFIAAKLRKETHGRGFRVQAQGPQCHLAREADGSSRFLMKPDITFLGPGERVLAVLDTKWKAWSEGKTAYGVVGDDMYQIVAYGMRYQCRNLTLVYPKQKKIQRDRIDFRINRTDPEMQVTVRFVDLERLVERGLDEQLSEAVAEAERLAALPAAA